MCQRLRRTFHNYLEPLLPLVLRTDTLAPSGFASGLGPSHTLAFISSQHEIYALELEMGDYDSAIDIEFLHRDLRPVRFDEDLMLFAHFAII